ncbi:hypothetical protein [Halalkalibacter alkaliphilus]|uniref:Uncharacterized protein n=1 Tax=Halalkalibacter alkaliphilus TaxID=2917993 RepID=A0A9X2CUL2_9BACI|nr:hypothetical protein [Halalkalibacter alkaliphilus]MCL7748534.1 hypothetical protein [Halalkalibacter alkaliphilus]
MFDFEMWSTEVFELIDEIEKREANHEDVTMYKVQLHELWNELFQQDNDMFVQFLKDVLEQTKGVLNGESDQSHLNKLVDEMRERVLKP